MIEKEGADREGASNEPAPESRRRPKRQLKAMIIGGALLIITGIVLAVYMAVYEDEPFLIALGPAFLGIIIIIAAVFGKRL